MTCNESKKKPQSSKHMGSQHTHCRLREVGASGFINRSINAAFDPETLSPSWRQRAFNSERWEKWNDTGTWGAKFSRACDESPVRQTFLFSPAFFSKRFQLCLLPLSLFLPFAIFWLPFLALLHFVFLEWQPSFSFRRYRRSVLPYCCCILLLDKMDKVRSKLLFLFLFFVCLFENENRCWRDNIEEWSSQQQIQPDSQICLCTERR